MAIVNQDIWGGLTAGAGVSSTVGRSDSVPSRIAVGNAVITEADILIMKEERKHPAIRDMVAVLLSIADNDDAYGRYIAVTHAEMPLAKLVTMQNDSSHAVREAVKRILSWSNE
jgi:hypothetical protein